MCDVDAVPIVSCVYVAYAGVRCEAEEYSLFVVPNIQVFHFYASGVH